MNRKLNYQNACGAGLDSGLPAAWEMEAEADSRNFKIALLAALMIHILLLWVVLPGDTGRVIDSKPHVNKPVVRILLKAPPEDPLNPVTFKKPMRLVPVPDPTPDIPEPAVSINAVEDTEIPTDSFIPENDDVPDVPMDVHTSGLVAPVYSMAQLQRNVVYPPLGLRAGMQGYVILQAVLNRDGRVTSVKVIGGTLNGLGFPEAAVSAVQKLKFRPGFYHGQPVNVVMNLTIHFRLRR